MFFSALAPAASTLAAVASGTRRNSSSSRRHAPDDARVLAAIPARGTSVAARRARPSVSGVYAAASLPLFTARSGDLSRRGHRFAVRTRAASDSGASSPREDANSPGFVGAPMSPGSPSGQILAHVLDNESHLFTAAVEATLDRMADELDQEETRANSVDVSEDESDRQGLVLFRRIQQMRALERRNGVQDVMYANILQKFRNIGVDMLPPMDEESVYLKGVDLNQLTNGVHSVEALEMVKEHLMGMLGPQASNAYSNSLVRMSKLQAAQMYAASIMFGYFLRRADKRFSLDRAAGTLPMNPSESAAALEALFNSASAMDSMDEADAGANARGFAAEEFAFDADGTGSGSGSGSEASTGAGANTTLKQYIQSFDQQTLAETARIVSLEGVVLAERQTGALFGSVEELAREMQSALEDGGEPITTPDQLMERVQDVVGGGKVKTVTLPVATQRRVVLEAVAFGSFLGDAESYVDAYDGRLLTPAPAAAPPGMIGGGGDGEEEGGGQPA